MTNWFINLNPISQTLLGTAFTFFITMLGASIVFLLKKISQTFIDSMLGLSAGIMIGASFFSLIIPSIEMSNKIGLNPYIILSLGFISGILLIYIGDNLFNILNKKSSLKRNSLLIFSVTLHNIPEGLAIGVAFGSTIYNLDGATILSALTLAIGIGIQNFPEGTVISMPLYRDGYSKTKSFIIGSLSALVEPIFGVIGVLLVLKMRLLLPFLLCLASGAMLYVVIEELIPESQTNKNKDIITIITLLGLLIMMILDNVL